MPYTIQIVQTIGTGLSRDTSLKVYRDTLEKLLSRQEDVPNLGGNLQKMAEFLEKRGIEVKWQKERDS